MKAEVRGLKAEVRDSVRVEQMVVAVHDTLTITKTITIRENEHGDTVRLSVVTDRDRVRERAQLKDKSEKLMVKTDTVYVERKDSVVVKSEELRVKSDRASPLTYLKVFFGIFVCLFILVLTFKVKRLFNPHMVSCKQ